MANMKAKMAAVRAGKKGTTVGKKAGTKRAVGKPVFHAGSKPTWPKKKK